MRITTFVAAIALAVTGGAIEIPMQQPVEQDGLHQYFSEISVQPFNPNTKLPPNH